MQFPWQWDSNDRVVLVTKALGILKASLVAPIPGDATIGFAKVVLRVNYHF